MSELKKKHLTEPRIFKKKGHEQLYKPNEQVKSAVNEAKDAVVAVKMAWRLKSHFSAWEEIGPLAQNIVRLQNSPHICVFKYTRAVKQKVWNEVENNERDWWETGVWDSRASRA